MNPFWRAYFSNGLVQPATIEDNGLIEVTNLMLKEKKP